MDITSLPEMLAVGLAIAYLLLAARENVLCWLCAALSTSIYIALFWNVSLVMDSILNIYYLAMAFYGWWRWQLSSGGERLPVRSWSGRHHLWSIVGVLLLATLSGLYLQHHTAAAWPYVDSFTTWGAVLTTWMVTQKILENWLYWLVIDAVSIPIYLDRGLYPTAALFAVYLVIVVFGYIAWLRQYRDSDHVLHPA